MDIRAEQLPEALLVTITGPLDRATAPRARQQLMPIASSIGFHEGQSLLLDLSGVKVLTGAGARVLYDLHVDLRHRSQALLLCAPTPAVADILAFTGLPRLVPVHADVAEARRALAP